MPDMKQLNQKMWVVIVGQGKSNVHRLRSFSLPKQFLNPALVFREMWLMVITSTTDFHIPQNSPPKYFIVAYFLFSIFFVVANFPLWSIYPKTKN